MDKNIQYRLLNMGEEIKEGDERFIKASSRWVPVSGVCGKVGIYTALIRRRCYEAELLTAFKEIRNEYWEGLPGKVGDLILATIALAEGRAE